MPLVIHPTQVTLPELIAWNHKAKYLSLRALKIAALQGGSYLSRFKGRGMEFEEVRRYQPGDDVRAIDWRVTARTNKPHTKLFAEEKERPVLFCLDLQESMFFSSSQAYKAVLGAHILALLAWAANHHHDRVGGMVFDEKSCHTVTPTLRQAGVLRLLNTVVQHEAWQSHPGLNDRTLKGEGLTTALLKLRKLARPGSLIFWISDWHPISEKALMHLQQIARHHDIVMIFMYDALEAKLPPPGQYPVQLNGQIHLLDTNDKRAQAYYAAQFESRRQTLASACLKMQAKFVPYMTHEDIYDLINNALNTQ